MASSRRLLAAAAALSECLNAKQIRHAFYGTITTVVLGSGVNTEDIFCIVEGSANAHPFRRVREALEGNEDWRVTNSPQQPRLFVTYQLPTPVIMIEILPSGEAGPRRIDNSTAMYIRGIPFLNITEFSRAKLRSWMVGQAPHDAVDLVFVLTRFWHRININRIPDVDMDRFVQHYPATAQSWESLKAHWSE